MNTRTNTGTNTRGDAWLWRLFATGLAFLAFGIGGLWLRFVVLPLLALWPMPLAQRRRQTRRIIHGAFRLLIHSLRGLRVIDVDTRGMERLGRAGQMIVANHPSLLDVVLLIGHLPDTNCIVKHSLGQNPCMQGPIAQAGYIHNRDVPGMIEAASKALQQGDTLIVFPEGTRTPADCTVAPLHRGAAAIALRGARVVTPVTIRMRPRSLGKSEPWWRIPAQRIRYRIEVGADIHPQNYAVQAPLPLASRRLNDFLQHHFAMELNQDGHLEAGTETANH